MDKRSLDNYIMGLGIHDSGEFVHQCLVCKVSWLTWMFYELGGWFYSRRQPDGREAEEGAYCPHCDAEGQLLEE